MPFMILYGGELVFMFLGARIARWMWRSREEVLALWRERHGTPPPSGPGFTPDPAVAPMPGSRASGAAVVALEARADGRPRELPQPLRRAA
jgi:hypothetical protein